MSQVLDTETIYIPGYREPRESKQDLAKRQVLPLEHNGVWSRTAKGWFRYKHCNSKNDFFSLARTGISTLSPIIWPTWREMWWDVSMTGPQGSFKRKLTILLESSSRTITVQTLSAMLLPHPRKQQTREPWWGTGGGEGIIGGDVAGMCKESRSVWRKFNIGVFF